MKSVIESSFIYIAAATVKSHKCSRKCGNIILFLEFVKLKLENTRQELEKVIRNSLYRQRERKKISILDKDFNKILISIEIVITHIIMNQSTR